MTLEITNELAGVIQQEARKRGKSVEDFLKIAIRRDRVLTARQKIEQEQEWWESLPLTKRAEYEGKYVAIHDKKLIDYDKDRDRLYFRVREKYGKTSVLIIPAEGPREIRIYSPRIIQR
jgi:hypothetical protein